jgi:hypothetical protein
MSFSFRPIPPKQYNIAQVRLEILSMLHKTARKMRQLLEETVATWDDKPEFKEMIAMAPVPSAIVIANGEVAFIWDMLNKGIKAHPIYPKSNDPNARLSFPWDGPGSYIPKTSPNSFSSGAGAKPQTPQKFAHVNHPGVEARNWTGKIASEYAPKFWVDCADALIAGLLKAGFQKLK